MASTGCSDNEQEHELDVTEFTYGDTGGTGAIPVTKAHVWLDLLISLGTDPSDRLLALQLAYCSCMGFVLGAFFVRASFAWDLTAEDKIACEYLADVYFNEGRQR